MTINLVLLVYSLSTLFLSLIKKWLVKVSIFNKGYLFRFLSILIVNLNKSSIFENENAFRVKGCGCVSAIACGHGLRIEKMIYIVCVAAVGGTGGGLSLSQADPVHCRYGRVLLLIRLGRLAVGISYRSYSGGRGRGPTPDIFIEARGKGTMRERMDVQLIISQATSRCTNL